MSFGARLRSETERGRREAQGTSPGPPPAGRMRPREAPRRRDLAVPGLRAAPSAEGRGGSAPGAATRVTFPAQLGLLNCFTAAINALNYPSSTPPGDGDEW